MKNTLIAIVLLTSYALTAQVAVLHPVHVPGDQVEKFLDVETNYSRKIAKDAIAKGSLNWWGLMRATNPSSDDSYNYMWVNVYADIDAAVSEAANWWANSKSVVGVSPDILYDGLSGIKSDRLYYYQIQQQIETGKNGKYVVFNFASPEDVNAILVNNKEVIIPGFKKNSKKSGMTGWGAATKITPQGSEYASFMTFDAFDTIANLMKHLSGEGAAIQGMDWESVVPINFESRYVFEVISSTDE